MASSKSGSNAANLYGPIKLSGGENKVEGAHLEHPRAPPFPFSLIAASTIPKRVHRVDQQERDGPIV